MPCARGPCGLTCSCARSLPVPYQHRAPKQQSRARSLSPSWCSRLLRSRGLRLPSSSCPWLRQSRSRLRGSSVWQSPASRGRGVQHHALISCPAAPALRRSAGRELPRDGGAAHHGHQDPTAAAHPTEEIWHLRAEQAAPAAETPRVVFRGCCRNKPRCCVQLRALASSLPCGAPWCRSSGSDWCWLEHEDAAALSGLPRLLPGLRGRGSTLDPCVGSPTLASLPHAVPASSRGLGERWGTPWSRGLPFPSEPGSGQTDRRTTIAGAQHPYAAPPGAPHAFLTLFPPLRPKRTSPQRRGGVLREKGENLGCRKGCGRALLEVRGEQAGSGVLLGGALGRAREMERGAGNRARGGASSPLPPARPIAAAAAFLPLVVPEGGAGTSQPRLPRSAEPIAARHAGGGGTSWSRPPPPDPAPSPGARRRRRRHGRVDPRLQNGAVGAAAAGALGAGIGGAERGGAEPDGGTGRRRSGGA